MEDFRKKLKRRSNLIRSFMSLILLLIVALNYFVPHNEGFQIGFTLGLALAAEILAAMYLAKCERAIKNEDVMKALYIEENDERSIYIKSQIGGLGLNVVIVSLIIATVVTGFFNEIVFFSLLATLLFSSLVKFSLKLYYKKKL